MTDIFEGHRPLVAILRGVKPVEVLGIAEALIESGFGIIEIPLNSPEAVKSIRLVSQHYGDKAIIGAGTVLNPDQVDAVCDAGGRLIVSPNFNADVIAKTRARDVLSFPGVFTPTEAFAAIDAGCHALKFFPSSLHGPGGIKAIKAVLPPQIPVLAVGGVSISTIGDWLIVGTNGFGIGSNVYKVGWDAQTVAKEAAGFVTAYDAALAEA